MSEEALDVKNIEQVAPASEASSASAEEKTIPYDRFQEKVREAQELKAMVNSLLSTQNQSQVADDGSDYVDAATLENRIISRVVGIQDEQRGLDQASRKFPEIYESPTLSAAAIGLRNEAMRSGRFISYEDAAQQIKEEMDANTQKAREAGRNEAQVSETVQKRAGLDAPTGGQSEKIDLATLFKSGQLKPNEIKENWNEIQKALLK
jgi:hypothetical protein